MASDTCFLVEVRTANGLWKPLFNTDRANALPEVEKLRKAGHQARYTYDGPKTAAKKPKASKREYRSVR